MMINYQLEYFCETWLKKAESYKLEELSDCFDKFFTLYVVYNRLYVEATFQAVKKGLITLDESKESYPDANAATKFLLKTLDSESVILKIHSDKNLLLALNELIKLIYEERFHITLSNGGEARREKDLVLVKNLKSSKSTTKMRAILDLIYLIRCNLFHGHKGYELTQRQLLAPICEILNFLTVELLKILTTS